MEQDLKNNEDCTKPEEQCWNSEGEKEKKNDNTIVAD